MAPKCTHFRHPTDEQFQHRYIYFFSNYYNLQSFHFELICWWINVTPRETKVIGANKSHILGETITVIIFQASRPWLWAKWPSDAQLRSLENSGHVGNRLVRERIVFSLKKWINSVLCYNYFKLIQSHRLEFRCKSFMVILNRPHQQERGNSWRGGFLFFFGIPL